ncbi:MAG: IPT/TIG domain-containing protein [Bryobacteraceae bacterium]|jgi:hypothetical protein
MKLSYIAPLLAAACIAACAQTAAPRMESVNPLAGKIGDIITVTGKNLQKAGIAKVYLTDGKTDIAVEVTEQTATTIKFKIPAKATGQMALMILTAEKEPKYIEQPVKVDIETP